MVVVVTTEKYSPFSASQFKILTQNDTTAQLGDNCSYKM